MAIREIILHQGPDARCSARLETAIALAQAYEARITGVYAISYPSMPRYLESQISEDLVEKSRQAFRDAATAAENAFSALVDAAGLKAEWRVVEGDPSEVLTAHGRYGDLVVMGQVDPEEGTYDPGFADEVILGAGRPVLMVPLAGGFTKPAKTVMVAWNGSREASRALHDALPFLKRAEKVIVYSVNPRNERHLTGADIATHLARHGVKTEAHHLKSAAPDTSVDSLLVETSDFGLDRPGVRAGSRHIAERDLDIGNALLAAISDMGADMLVMGAYGHSRLRELLLGGATRHLLGEMTVPVLLSH